MADEIKYTGATKGDDGLVIYDCYGDEELREISQVAVGPKSSGKGVAMLARCGGGRQLGENGYGL